MTDDEEVGRVVAFPPRPKARNQLDAKTAELDVPIGRAPGHRDCRHAKCSLDVTGRYLRCQACEQVIDPIDWIEELAREWDRYVSRWRAAVGGIRRAEEELADLERRGRNAKARLKRHRVSDGQGRLHRDVNWLDLGHVSRAELGARVRRALAGRVTVAADGAHVAPVMQVVEAVWLELERWDTEDDAWKPEPGDRIVF